MSDEFPSIPSQEQRALPLELAAVWNTERYAFTNRRIDAKIAAAVKHAPNQQLPYSTFMELQLYDPQDGYYATGHAEVGVDFITSPEKTALFGATIGVATAKVWESMGKPERFKIIEMGAGNGTLALDLLQWAKQHNKDFYDRLQYTILEYGALISKQQAKLQQFNTDHKLASAAEGGVVENKVDWVQGSASELPFAQVEGVFLSNELPDAFPVERVMMVNGKLQQRYVTLAPNNKLPEYEVWQEVWSEPSPEVVSYIQRHTIVVGDTFDIPINLPAEAWQKNLDRALKKGAIITIDYGHFKNDSSVKKAKFGVRVYHRKNARNQYDLQVPYFCPGDTDITSDVDFEVLREIAAADGLNNLYEGIQPNFLVSQGLNDIIAPVIEEARTTRSLATLQRLMKQVRQYRAITAPRQNDNFCVQILSKGIPTDIFPSSTELPLHTDMPSYALSFPKISQDVQEIYVIRNTSYYGKQQAETAIAKGDYQYAKLVRTPDGTFSPNGFPTSLLDAAELLGGLKVVTSSGEVVETYPQTMGIKTILQQSGYIYDIPPPYLKHLLTK